MPFGYDKSNKIEVMHMSDVFDDSFSKLYERTKGLKVLYAEDSSTMRHALTKELLKYFNVVDVASDGKEALLMYLQYHDKTGGFYDIVFSDLEMPRMDGEALSRTILDLHPKQELVIISSINDYHRIIDLVNLGIKKFLAKPIDGASLYRSVVEISSSIREHKIAQEDFRELEEHNRHLKQKERLYLSKLTRNLQELGEINDALNESGVVSKTDANGKIIYVNSLFCTLSGYSADELMGNTHRMVSACDMASSFYMKFWNTISSGKSYRGVFKNRSKNGEIYYLESLVKPINNSDGEVVEYVAIGHNITAVMESLESTKRVNEAKESFFRNMSHEMRTPLNAISGLVSLLIRKMKDDKKTISMLEAVSQSTQQLGELIESMIDMQNINSGRLVLQNSEFSILSLVDGCQRAFSKMAQESDISFDVSFDLGEDEIFFGDMARVAQVVKILLSNAFKFNKKGGFVELKISRVGDLLEISVRDGGIGIAAENLESIFSAHQVDSSLIRNYEGSGLGLSIAKALVVKMGGEIVVSSTLDKGSIFSVTVPLAS